ncbi:MAG: alpha/beta fold hydrolase [Microgenomates group bacterium]
MKKYLPLIFGFFLVIPVIGVFYSVTTKGTHVSLPSARTLTPTPFPLEGITIPSLRKRQYTSELKDVTQYETYPTYTAFLTHYLSDTYKINALLTKPNGPVPQGGWPAIVFVHGYIPPNQYETTERYTAYVNYLASQGFVVLKIDLRGHGTSEGKASGAYYSADYVIDTLNAYAALQKASFVNPKRIGLWGHSMAGNIVLRSFAVHPTIPAVVIWAGAGYSYEDIQRYRIQDASYQRTANTFITPSVRRNTVTQLYGAPNLRSNFWKQLAPVSYLNDLKGAIQLHHAVDDETVNVGYSRDLNALLDKTKVIHEFFEYPTGGHNIADPSFQTAIERTAEFYKAQLVK